MQINNFYFSFQLKKSFLTDPKSELICPICCFFNKKLFFQNMSFTSKELSRYELFLKFETRVPLPHVPQKSLFITGLLAFDALHSMCRKFNSWFFTLNKVINFGTLSQFNMNKIGDRPRFFTMFWGMRSTSKSKNCE